MADLVGGTREVGMTVQKAVRRVLLNLGRGIGRVATRFLLPWRVAHWQMALLEDDPPQEDSKSRRSVVGAGQKDEIRWSGDASDSHCLEGDPEVEHHLFHHHTEGMPEAA